MTNGELFIRENPNIKFKINGSCVWIYYPDGVNHYTMPVSWWDKEIGLFDRITAEIEAYQSDAFYSDDVMMNKRTVLGIIDKYRNEVSK